MKKWQLYYHEKYGIGIITKNVYKNIDYVYINFNNKKIRNIKIAKNKLKPILINNQKIEIQSLF